MPLSEGGPVPADSFFGPSHGNENRNPRVLNRFISGLLPEYGASVHYFFKPVRKAHHLAGLLRGDEAKAHLSRARGPWSNKASVRAASLADLCNLDVQHVHRSWNVDSYQIFSGVTGLNQCLRGLPP